MEQREKNTIDKNQEAGTVLAVTITKGGDVPTKHDTSRVHNTSLECGVSAKVWTDKDAGEPTNGPNPWTVNEEEDSSPKFSEMTLRQKLVFVLFLVLRLVLVLGLLILFICSLTLLTRSFQLIGGKVAGRVIGSSRVLQNPVCGLVLGILVTVLLQSSSTSTSLVVSLVAAGILPVKMAIPIVMGANIGTSVTNTIVSITQADDRDVFRRAFGGATVHDMFNWLSVIILLPVEVAFGYLYHLTTAITRSLIVPGGAQKIVFINAITKPFADLFVMLNKKVIEGIAKNDPRYAKKSLLLFWCRKEVRQLNRTFHNGTIDWNWVNNTVEGKPIIIDNNTVLYNASVGVVPCRYLFHNTGLPDPIIGLILLIISLALLITCLVSMVKILQSLLKSSVATVIKKTINSDFPGPCAFLTGYAAILAGAGVTVLVQSSSVFTSTLTPLVGIGVVTLERVYPLTLGSNIGTTVTSFLAALTTTGPALQKSLQISFVHLFFNVTGIVIFYPIPFMRKIPISLARGLGNKTARYRWFALLYLVVMFFLLPGIVFALSLAGLAVFLGVFIPFLVILIVIAIINIMQSKMPQILPQFLRDWSFLPLFMHSLEPYDGLITKARQRCVCCKCCECKRNRIDLAPEQKIEGVLNGSYMPDIESKHRI